MGCTSDRGETLRWPSEAICACQQSLACSHQRPFRRFRVDSYLLATTSHGEARPLRRGRGFAVRRPKRALLYVASAAGNN